MSRYDDGDGGGAYDDDSLGSVVDREVVTRIVVGGGPADVDHVLGLDRAVVAEDGEVLVVADHEAVQDAGVLVGEEQRVEQHPAVGARREAPVVIRLSHGSLPTQRHIGRCQ